MFTRVFLILITLVLVACDQGGTVDGKIAAARLRNDGPAMWIAKDVDSTLYLFGTLHILPADLNWQRDDMKAAFDSAGTVFFEVDTGDRGQVAATVLTSSLGMYRDGRRLSDRLDSYELKLLEAAANNGQLSLAALDSMKPWLAAEFLTVAAGVQAGLSPDFAADNALKSRADRLSKNVIYLDTVESQIKMSAEQPDFVQMMVLADTLAAFNDMGRDASRAAQAWSVGQTEFLTTEIINAAKARSPDFYQSVFTDRNITWAKEFDKFLQGSGTGFAAIGVGHLLGEESVVRRLRDQGYEVNRYFAFQGDPVIKTVPLGQ